MSRSATTTGPPPAPASRRGRGHAVFVVAGAIMLALMLAGFYPFYLRGEGQGGRQIAPDLLALVVVHGSALTAWVGIFFCQALLVSARKVRVHMRLGWVGAAVAVVGATSGFALAVRSAVSDPEFPFWGVQYRQFLLVMLAEMTLFALFVAAGVVTRRKPRIHRAMMLLATLSVIAGATVRVPALYPVFGLAGWPGVFGPAFALGALLLIVLGLLGRQLDRPLAAGYAVMVAFYILAFRLAVTGTWDRLARSLFGI